MWVAPNKEGVGHAASCRFVDLGWWERRCRCDSIECELDAASSVPFKIKSSIALAYYWCLLSIVCSIDNNVIDFLIKVSQAWHAFKELLVSWCDDPIVPSRQSRKHLSHSRVLQWCVDVEHVWTLLCDGGGSRGFLQNKIGMIYTIRYEKEVTWNICVPYEVFVVQQ